MRFDCFEFRNERKGFDFDVSMATEKPLRGLAWSYLTTQKFPVSISRDLTQGFNSHLDLVRLSCGGRRASADKVSVFLRLQDEVSLRRASAGGRQASGIRRLSTRGKRYLRRRAEQERAPPRPPQASH